MFDELFHRSGLSFERLHALIQLGEEGTLIRAAKGDSGRQSRLSHHLKELSAYFGVELTERVGKNLRLTPSGEKLVQLARQQFENLLQFRREIQGNVPVYRLGAGDSLLQWLVIPTIASLRRPQGNFKFTLQNFATDEIIARLFDQRLDFGLVPGDAVVKGLSKKSVCRVRHIIVVPDRIGVRRGMLTLKHALLECPHAVLLGDGVWRQSIDGIARELGGQFEPELQCESVSQCVAAVQTGQFAAVLPDWSWDAGSKIEHGICDDQKLEGLDRKLVLTWSPRFLQTGGTTAQHAINSLMAGLAQDSSRRAGEDETEEA